MSDVEIGRRAYRRTQNTRSVLVSLVSTLVFAIVIWLLVINTPGWERVQRSFFDLDTAIAAWPRVIAGLWVNIQVLFFASIGVLVLSILIATIRTLRGPIWFPLRASARGGVHRPVSRAAAHHRAVLGGLRAARPRAFSA